MGGGGIFNFLINLKLNMGISVGEVRLYYGVQFWHISYTKSTHFSGGGSHSCFKVRC